MIRLVNQLKRKLRVNHGFHGIKCYLHKQDYLINATTMNKKTLRRLASKFFLSGDVLYTRNHDIILLRYVGRHEAGMFIKEIHEGSFGTHANGNAMAKKIIRVDYYLLTV